MTVGLERIVPGILTWPSRLSRRMRYRRFLGKSAEQIFTEFYRTNRWGSDESRSGPASTLADTDALRRRLPRLIERLGCRSILDIPCGDFQWMSHVPLGIPYTGADIVEELVAINRSRYGDPSRTFLRLDITCEPLPAADLVLTRDCFLHLSLDDIRAALRQIRLSGARYLLASTWPRTRWNADTPTGIGYRFVNLERAPFHLPPPLEMINEESKLPNGKDRHMALWRVEHLRAAEAGAD